MLATSVATYGAEPPEKICLRCHKIDGKVVAVMFVAHISVVNWIVCSFCEEVANWNTVGKHLCGKDKDKLVAESEDAWCELLAENDDDLHMFDGRGQCMMQRKIFTLARSNIPGRMQYG